MKRIIDGKVYDTETATIVAEASASCSVTDFRHWEETLYRTPRGRWFVHGEGGPMSRWSRAIDSNSWTGGSGIIALSEAEALSWCEEHNIDAGVVGEYFKLETA